MSSTPVWVPLAVAGVGVAGTLGATWLTRRSADRREDERWKREREAEETRWQRERDERREEWQREDAARWLTERKAVYAEFLLSLEVWRSAIMRAAVEGRTYKTLTEKTRASLYDLEQKSQSFLEILSMLAPEPTLNLAVESISTLGSWTSYVDSTVSDKAADPHADAKTDYFEQSIFNEQNLREAIRQDLGVDPPSA